LVSEGVVISGWVRRELRGLRELRGRGAEGQRGRGAEGQRGRGAEERGNPTDKSSLLEIWTQCF